MRRVPALREQSAAVPSTARPDSPHRPEYSFLISLQWMRTVSLQTCPWFSGFSVPGKAVVHIFKKKITSGNKSGRENTACFQSDLLFLSVYTRVSPQADTARTHSSAGTPCPYCPRLCPWDGSQDTEGTYALWYNTGVKDSSRWYPCYYCPSGSSSNSPIWGKV